MARYVESGGNGGLPTPQKPTIGQRARAFGEATHRAVVGRAEHNQLTVADLQRIGARVDGIQGNSDVVDPQSDVIKQNVILQFPSHADTGVAEKSAEERALELLVPGHMLVAHPNGDIRLRRTNQFGGDRVRIKDLPRLYLQGKADPENIRTWSSTWTSLKLDAVSFANFADPLSKARSTGKSGIKHLVRGGVSTYAPLKDTILASSHPRKIPAEAHGLKGVAVAVLGGVTKFGAIAAAVDIAMLAKAELDRMSGRNVYRIRPLAVMLGTDLIHSLAITPASGYSMRRALGLYQTIAEQERAQDMRHALEDFDAANPSDKAMMHLKGYMELKGNLWRRAIGRWEKKPAKAERKFAKEVWNAKENKKNLGKLRRKDPTPDLTFGQIDRAHMPKNRQDAYYTARDLRKAFALAEQILASNPQLVKRLRRW